MEVIERRIAEGDTSPLTWYWAGLVLERRGELVDALVRYSQAVDHLTTEEIGRSPWTRLMASSRRRVKWVLGLELDGIDAIGEVGEVEEADRYFDLLDLLRTPAVVNGQVRVWSRAELAEAREFRPGRITADSIEAYYRQVEDVLREHGEPVAVEFWTFELFMNRVNALLANHAHDLPEEEPIEDEAVGAVWPPGRNEPCWCGSARKYKKCCGSGHPSGRPQAWGPAGLRAGAEVAVGRV
ncbi:SEC-C motif-containing protein [Kribbella jejuensis]|uniref:SEC-C motif-containing protein n=2 Tax=Kribbella jejuensis TaxID=236068 RepID=A0A542EM88_9ACTN|nr:SEC-C motif-containing protein [Kribbella jejuensis]